MQLKATDQQIRQIAANACAASKPMGMGYLHWKADQVFTADMIPINNINGRDEIYLDYIGGRMVKLLMFRVGEDIWEFRDGVPNPEYQSWCHKYPTYLDLAMSVAGVEAMK